MQITFLVKLGFWVKGLVTRYYKNHMDGKGVVDKT